MSKFLSVFFLIAIILSCSVMSANIKLKNLKRQDSSTFATAGCSTYGGPCSGTLQCCAGKWACSALSCVA